LSNIAKLDTMVTVVDGHNFLKDYDTLDRLKTRGMEAAPEDERTVAQLLADQLEFANVILLNKCDLLSDEDRGRLRQIISLFNPTAEIVETINSNVSIELMLHCLSGNPAYVRVCGMRVCVHDDDCIHSRPVKFALSALARVDQIAYLRSRWVPTHTVAMMIPARLFICLPVSTDVGGYAGADSPDEDPEHG